MSFGALAMALVAASGPLTLDEAIEIAQVQARDAVRAQNDVLIVDAQRLRAIGAVLPRVDLSLRGAGTHQDSIVVEAPLYLNCESSLRAEACDDVPYFPPREGFDQNAAVDEVRDQFILNDLFLANFSAGITVRQTIYDGGRWWTEIGRFEDLQRLRRATLQEVLNNVRLRVVQAFYGLERALQSQERFELRMRLGEKQLDSARALMEKGEARAFDVASAERNLAEDRLAFARARFSASRSRRALNLALARPARTDVAIVLPAHVSTSSASAPKLAVPTLDDALEAARRHRAALEIQRANVDQLMKFVDTRRAELFPELTVGGSYRKFSRRADRVFTDPLNRNFYAGFDVTVRWNLYRGGIDEQLIQEAELNVVKARADYAEVERQVMSEVEDRVENLELQLQIYALALDSLRPATVAVESVRGRYKDGKATLITLRDAELKYTAAQVSAINARLDVEIARELLRRAIGADLVTGLDR
ncbi:MAG: TolC family protein [Deltaproteobacteria bacterium]